MRRPLEWSNAFSVAHPQLDNEHREIMLMIRRIAEGGSDHNRLRPLLCEIKNKTAAHFAHENAILREIVASTSSARSTRKFLAAMSQALVDEHEAEHSLALTALDSMIRSTLADTSRRAEPLAETLTRWFVNHAVIHDAHLKTLFQTVEADCPELLTQVG